MEKSALFWLGEQRTFLRNTIIPVNSTGEVTKESGQPLKEQRAEE
jgi:hypothetical protein